MRIVLVGMPAVGKSVVGLALADFLRTGFVDVDQDICSIYGDIRDIFLVGGESYFRDLEYQRILSILEGFCGVISLGGGAVTFPATYSLLEKEFVVFLRANLATVSTRILGDTGRPLLGDDPIQEWQSLEVKRRYLYEGVADVVVDIDGLSVLEIIVILENYLSSRGVV